MGRKRSLAAALVAVALVGLPACGRGREKDVTITLEEWSISMSPPITDSGRIKTHITQAGTLHHELLLVRFPAEGSELPTTPTGAVDEAQVNVADEIAAFEPGHFQATFPQISRGNYLLICNLVTEGVSHYQQGMRMPIRVTQSIEDAPIL